MPDATPPSDKRLSAPRAFTEQAGKIGLAILMWLLGVPGLIVLLYLLLG